VQFLTDHQRRRNRGQKEAPPASSKELTIDLVEQRR
jgi:hypothetical protein